MMNMIRVILFIRESKVIIQFKNVLGVLHVQLMMVGVHSVLIMQVKSKILLLQNTTLGAQTRLLHKLLTQDLLYLLYRNYPQAAMLTQYTLFLKLVVKLLMHMMSICMLIMLGKRLVLHALT